MLHMYYLQFTLRSETEKDFIGMFSLISPLVGTKRKKKSNTTITGPKPEYLRQMATLPAPSMTQGSSTLRHQKSNFIC